jgi:phenylacetate-CoA ligase
MLIIRGVNVFPSAIEGIVRRFPAIEEFQIEVFRDGELEEARVLIETNGGDGRTVCGLLQEALRASLGLRLEVMPAPHTLPRFELKARRVIRRYRPEG